MSGSSEADDNVKDASIRELLARLTNQLGVDAFRVVEFWDADRCAIGIVRSNANRSPVYISTWHQPPGTYFVSLEPPPLPGSDAPYEPAGEFEVADFEELVGIIVEHLGISNARPSQK